MKKIYFLGLFIICGLLYGYKNGNKESFLSSNNYFAPPKSVPQGMVLIPQGKALIGMTDEDLTFYQGNPSKMTSFSAFFMDETETTNAQYRKFVNWVRDSIAITSMRPSGAPALYKPNPQNNGANTSIGVQAIDWRKIDKKSTILWGKSSQYKSKLQDMYYAGKDALSGKNEIDVRRLKYAYSYLNLDLAVAGANDPNKKRQDFIVTYSDNPTPGIPNEFPSVSVYPDTTVWKKDFNYSQNDPMVKTYFNHPSYDNYPVVGVSWEQANAFCNWRTKEDSKTDVERKTKRATKSEYRLPTDQEFEYAARGGRTQTKYPWEGAYLYGPCKTSNQGCLLANFKAGRGNYADDNGMYTVKVGSYDKNDFGLFDMAGNVAEWTSTSYNRSSASLLLDFNPNYNTIASGDKVVRGGSWKDIGFFLQNSVSTYEKQDKSRSYIGFRCVSSLVGSTTK